MAQSLAERVRAKFPGKYDDLSDEDLEDKIVEKHPVYKDLVGPREAKPLLKVDQNPDTDRLLSEAKDTLKKPAVWESDNKGDKDAEEAEFQSWYKDRAAKLGIDPNPDDPRHFYDYRAAHKAGAEPDPVTHHWPSEFKKEGHPRQVINGIDTKTGKPALGGIKEDQAPPQEESGDFFDSVNKFLGEHPRIHEFLTGSSPQFEQSLKEHGLSPQVKGPGLQKIPGVQKAADFLANQIDPTDAREDRDWTRSFLAGAVQGVGGLAEVGADPRSVGTGPEPLIRLPKSRGLPPGPTEFGPTARGDIFDAEFRPTETPRPEPIRPPVRNVTPERPPAPVPEQPIEPPIKQPTKPAAAAVKPGFTGNEQTEFTNSKGDISLRKPTPDRIAQLQDDGYTVTRTLPDGSVVLSPKPAATAQKGTFDPFNKPPTPAAPIATQAPAQEFANQVEPEPIPQQQPIPQEEPYRGQVTAAQQFANQVEPVTYRQDVVPELTPPEFHPTDIEPAPQQGQPQPLTEDKLYDMARERFRMGLDRPEQAPISFEDMTSENPPIIDDTGNTQWIPEENQPEPVKSPEALQKFADSIRAALEEENLFKPAPKRDLPPALEGESVMDYHNRTGSSITEAERMVEGEDADRPNFSRTWNPSVGADNPTHSGTISERLETATLEELHGYKTTLENNIEKLKKDATLTTPTGSAKRRIAFSLARLNTINQAIAQRDEEPQFDRIPKEGPFKTTGNVARFPTKPTKQQQLYDTVENVRHMLSTDETGPEFNRDLEDFMVDASISIRNETDPAIIKDNFQQMDTYLEDAKLHGNTDQVEFIGQLRDMALEAFKRINKGEGPSFARSEKGGIKIGQNIRRSAQELTTGYSQPLTAIMVREGGQNGIDAIRHLGPKGIVTFLVDKEGLTISDNGKGMDRGELETVFSNLHESGKTTEGEATGGKGIGKATYILGGSHFEAKTVKLMPSGKKIMSTLGGTPEEFHEHVAINESEVHRNTPTGTTIKTTFAPGQDRFDAEHMMAKIKHFSRDLPGQMSYSRGPLFKMTPPSPFKESDKDLLIEETTINGNKVTILQPTDAHIGARYSFDVHYLNNGMYQFSKNNWIGEETPGLPEYIIVNVQPSAEEGSPAYPFPTQRESLKDNVQSVITELINSSITGPAKNRRKSRLQELYDSMNTINVGGTERPIVFYDPGDRLTPEEKQLFINSPVMQKYAKFVDGLIDDILTISEHDDWIERVEQVGIVLDPGMHGVHIPNPSTGLSTILMNPFEHIANNMNGADEAALSGVFTAMHEVAHVGKTDTGHSGKLRDEELDHPGIGRYLQEVLTQNAKHGGRDLGHGVNFIKRLGEVFATFGPRRTFDAAEKLNKIFSNTIIGYNSQIQELFLIYKERSGRPEVTEDLLSPTGESQAASKRGKGSDGGDIKRPAGRATRKRKQQDVSGAVDALLNALEEAKGSREEQQEINRKTRAERFAAFSGVKDPGMAGAAKSLGKLSGKFEKVDVSGFQDSISADQVDSLFDAVKYAVITPAEKARGYTALFTLLEGGDVPSRSELAVLDEVFGGGFANKIIEMHSGVPIKLTKTANTMKAMRSSFDTSAPLRQGIMLIHRPEWYKAFALMFKYMVNPEAYQAAMESIKDHPLYLVAREAGLFLAKPDDLVNGEEVFMNTYIPQIGKVPLAGPLIKMGVNASERAYTGFLNMLRFDVFKSLVREMKDSGSETYTVTHEIDEDTGEKTKASIVTSKAVNDVAKMINISTGRGTLGRLEKMAPELNAVIWSPRLLAARLQVLNPKYYKDLDPIARREAIKGLFAIATVGTIVTGLMYLKGRKVGVNPTTADFLKARKGTSVVDGWSGYQQELVAAARFITGVSNGRSKTRTETVEQFLAQKLSPMAALAYEVGSAKKWEMKNGHPTGNFTNRYGQKKNLSTEIINSFVPMFIQDAVDMAKTDLAFAEKVGLDIYSNLGGGVQNYPEANTKKPGKGMSISKPSIR